MKILFNISIFLLCLNCPQSSESGLCNKKYLEEVFIIIETNSIRKDSVNFDLLKKSAIEKLNNAKSIEDCHNIVRSILKQLGDKHSIFLSKVQVDGWKSTSNSTDIEELITFDGRLINEEIGYINMKSFNSGDSLSILGYANKLQTLIKTLDNVKIKGWILDIRGNSGGNCWPMLAGLGPLLNNGTCGYFIDNKNNKSAWYHKDGEVGIDSSAIARVSIEPYELIKKDNPIAVLTGPRTASSGEVVAVSFREKTHTQSFGENTGGLSTGNSGFELSDGSMIFLTTSIFADRKGISYGRKIAPTILVRFTYNDIGTQKDQVIERAVDWIYSY